MFPSTASKLSMLKNTEAFLSRFKWMLNEEDYEDSETAVIELGTGQSNQSLAKQGVEVNINSTEQEYFHETSELDSLSMSPSESLNSVPQTRTSKTSIVKAQDSLENLDLTSFEVVQEGLDVCNTVKDDSKEPQIQNNGFGDAGNTTLDVYAQQKSSSVKSFFSSFLEQNGDGCVVPFTGTPSFQKEAIIIGDIFSTAVQGIKAGVSFLLGDAKSSYKEDVVHYRGYKLRTKGMELFLDSVLAKNNYQPNESSANEGKVHFQFKLSNSNRFWQNKELKTIISLPLKVYWLDGINSTSMFVEVFDSDIELEMPIGIPKDSIVVSCDPDKGTLSILAPPSYSQ